MKFISFVSKPLLKEKLDPNFSQASLQCLKMFEDIAKPRENILGVNYCFMLELGTKILMQGTF